MEINFCKLAHLSLHSKVTRMSPICIYMIFKCGKLQRHTYNVIHNQGNLFSGKWYYQHVYYGFIYIKLKGVNCSSFQNLYKNLPTRSNSLCSPLDLRRKGTGAANRSLIFEIVKSARVTQYLNLPMICNSKKIENIAIPASNSILTVLGLLKRGSPKLDQTLSNQSRLECL